MHNGGRVGVRSSAAGGAALPFGSRWRNSALAVSSAMEGLILGASAVLDPLHCGPKLDGLLQDGVCYVFGLDFLSKAETALVAIVYPHFRQAADLGHCPFEGHPLTAARAIRRRRQSGRLFRTPTQQRQSPGPVLGNDRLLRRHSKRTRLLRVPPGRYQIRKSGERPRQRAGRQP